MNKSLAYAAIFAGALQAVSPAGAYSVPEMSSSQLPSATALADAEGTLAPLAFVQFCMSNRDQCDDNASAKLIAFDEDSWGALQEVNTLINGRIRADQAKGSYGWSLDARTGNCNDYAVQKRDELIRRGYPMAALSLAAVITPWGEGHLVLTVRTDRGDFVLDNLKSRVVAWNKTGYRWLKRQSAENPRYWVALNGKGVQAKPAPKRQPREVQPESLPQIAEPLWPMVTPPNWRDPIDSAQAPAWTGTGPLQLAAISGAFLAAPTTWRGIEIVGGSAAASIGSPNVTYGARWSFAMSAVRVAVADWDTGGAREAM